MTSNRGASLRSSSHSFTASCSSTNPGVPALAAGHDWGMFGLKFLKGMARDPVSALPAECFERHDVMRRIAHRHVLFPSAPDTVRDVFRADGQLLNITPMQVRRFRPAIGDGMIAASGIPWQRQRDCGKALLTEAMSKMQEAQEIGAFAKELRAILSQPSDDVFATLKKACLTRFIDLLFQRGTKAIDTLPVEDFVTAVDAFIMPRQSLTLADIVPLPAQAAHRTHAFDSLIESEGQRIGLTQRLEKKGVPVRDFVVSMLIGFYPTALVLVWLAIVASTNAALHNRLHTEAQATNAEDIRPRSMPFTMASLREIMRLYPPFPFATREVLRNGVLGAHAVRRGTFVLLSPYLIHRHKRLWRNPEHFDPARFSGTQHDRNRYLPFGGGQRHCIGSALSMRVLLEGAHALFVDGLIPTPCPRPVRERGMFVLLPDQRIAWPGL